MKAQSDYDCSAAIPAPGRAAGTTHAGTAPAATRPLSTPPQAPSCPPGTDAVAPPYPVRGAATGARTIEVVAPALAPGEVDGVVNGARAAGLMGRAVLALGGVGTGVSGLVLFAISAGMLELRPVSVLPFFLCSFWLLVAYAAEAGAGGKMPQ